MRSKLRDARAISRDRRRRAVLLRRLVRKRVPYRLVVVGVGIAAVTLLATASGLTPRSVAGAEEHATSGDGAAPDPSVEGYRGQPRALQSAGITADDVPIDASGRSAKTGRVIPGIRPRRPIPPEVQQALDGLNSRATRATESLPSDGEPVVITDLPGDPARQPRMDSADRDQTSQPTIAPVERNR